MQLDVEVITVTKNGANLSGADSDTYPHFHYMKNKQGLFVYVVSKNKYALGPISLPVTQLGTYLYFKDESPAFSQQSIAPDRDTKSSPPDEDNKINKNVIVQVSSIQGRSKGCVVTGEIFYIDDARNVPEGLKTAFREKARISIWTNATPDSVRKAYDQACAQTYTFPKLTNVSLREGVIMADDPREQSQIKGTPAYMALFR